MPNNSTVYIGKTERIKKELEILHRDLESFKAEENNDRVTVVKLKIEELLLELDDC